MADSSFYSTEDENWDLRIVDDLEASYFAVESDDKSTPPGKLENLNTEVDTSAEAEDRLLLDAMLEFEASLTQTNPTANESPLSRTSLQSVPATPQVDCIPETPMSGSRTVGEQTESVPAALPAPWLEEWRYGSGRDATCPAKRRLYDTAADNDDEREIKRCAVSDNQLSLEQQAVVKAVMRGKSVFFTGAAGTGKSHLLRHIIQLLPRDTTFVTAPTGIAACHIGGVTLHNFAGIGLGNDPVEKLAGNARKGEAGKRWRKAAILVIDEISMVSAELFDKLEALARAVRGNDKPFGGVQLVICGDFYQLPPVSMGSSVHLCLQAASWGRCITEMFELQQIFRQSDVTLVKALNEVRRSQYSPETIQLLNRCRYTDLRRDDGIEPTVIYPHNKDVDDMNNKRLAALQGEEIVYTADDKGTAPFLEMLQRSCPARARIALKIGAQVVLLRNMDPAHGLVNGARGVISGFSIEGGRSRDARLPYVRFVNGQIRKIERKAGKWTIDNGNREVARRLQLPLALGWAMSIHKCQGMTLDCVEMSLANVFEPGMAYVALSRVRSLSCLKLLSFQPNGPQVPSCVSEFYAGLTKTMAPAQDQQQPQEQQPCLQQQPHTECHAAECEYDALAAGLPDDFWTD